MEVHGAQSIGSVKWELSDGIEWSELVWVSARVHVDCVGVSCSVLLTLRATQGAASPANYQGHCLVSL